jgi:hypothetical protein
MTELIAKTIIKDQFWIITDGDKKIGNIEANNAGYGLKLNGSFLQFNNTEELKERVQIRFEPLKTNKTKAALPYPQYPTPPRIYNSLFDIKRGLHLFTETRKSKCQHAAGWFIIDQGSVRQVVFCPKYIFIQRYPYQGPFKTEDEANSINIS